MDERSCRKIFWQKMGNGKTAERHEGQRAAETRWTLKLGMMEIGVVRPARHKVGRGVCQCQSVAEESGNWGLGRLSIA